jgi:hypothetical protein
MLEGTRLYLCWTLRHIGRVEGVMKIFVAAMVSPMFIFGKDGRQKSDE